MKILLAVAAAYALLVVALRSRRPVGAGRGAAPGPKRSVEARVRAVVDRVNLVIILGLVATAIYVVVTRVLWDL